MFPLTKKDYDLCYYFNEIEHVVYFLELLTFIFIEYIPTLKHIAINQYSKMKFIILKARRIKLRANKLEFIELCQS